ncbi:MAG TPA: FecR domain-containing protein [Puia sp.]|jgi:ferric-dicitrate binding protein FerR (iron transport regulator)
MKDISRLQELFGLYQQRRCTPVEVEELVRLLQQADAESGLSDTMHELWEQFREHRAEYEVDWEGMYHRISRSEDDLYTLRHRPPFSFRRWIYPAAAVFMFGLLIPAAWRVFSKRTVPAVTIAGTPKIVPPVPGEVRRRVLHLPDGSTVTLNKKSRLDYAPGLAGAAREVFLTGEAFFDIVHAPGRPFLVHTGNITTRVLGTSFNIKAYPSDRSVEITVAHGKVQVLEEKKNMGLLSDAQQMRLRTDSILYELKKVDVTPVIAWRPREIRFDDITLSEVGKQVQQRFGKVLRFSNPSLGNCRVTATFYEDDDLDEIMTVICGISQSTYAIRDNEIAIDGNGCN